MSAKRDIIVALLFAFLLAAPFWGLYFWWQAVCNPCGSVIVGWNNEDGFYQKVIAP